MDDFKTLKENLEILKDLKTPWFVCGGWAIDLFLNRKTREHADIDIGILREYQFELKDHLKGFSFFYLQDGKKYPWLAEKYLELPVHEVHAQKDDLKLEILLNEAEKGKWVFRRNPSVTLSLDEMEAFSEKGLKYLVPEIVLLYKSKNPQAKDQLDFENVLPHLTQEQKIWLKESLSKIQPEHPWIPKL